MRQSFRRTVILLAFATGCAPSGSHAPVPARPLDVQDYDLTLSLPDTGSLIDGRAVLAVQRSSRADNLPLDLVGLTVDSVLVDGAPVSFRRSADRVLVPLPPGGTGSYQVAVRYHGTPTDGLIIRSDSAGRWTGFGDNWPNRARFWIPSVDHPSDKATVSWHVEAPATRTIVANGTMTERRELPGSDRAITSWRESRPIPVYLMVIAAAPLTRYDLGETACGFGSIARCVPQMVYVAPEQQGVLPGAFSAAGRIVEYFSRVIAPFPYEKLAHLQSSTRFGGMENASAIFYADETVRRGRMSQGLIAHETAHQWFGDAVTEREWPHLWLSEGFATYFAALWTRQAVGDSAFRRELTGMRQEILTDTAVVPTRPVIDTIETNLLALLNNNSYAKGGFVLRMLNAQLGDSAFFRGLRDYYAEHVHGNATSDDLRASLEKSSGRDLGWFFDQWLRRPGYADLTVTWGYDPSSQAMHIAVDQTDRFGYFRMPLTVDVYDTTGRRRRVHLDIPAQRHVGVEVGVPREAPPVRLVLDPDVEALALLHVIHKD